MAKVVTPRRWGKSIMGNIAGAPPVFGGFGTRFEVGIKQERDVCNDQTIERYFIHDKRLMKIVEGSVTPNEEEALALCKLMNEGEKL